jgi:two-component system, NarL family, sensor histidine kinase DesK
MTRRAQTAEARPSEGLAGTLGHALWRDGRPSVLLRLAPLLLVLPPLVTFLFARPSDERLISLVPAIAGFVAIVVWVGAAERPALPRRALVAAAMLSLLAVAVTLADPRGVWLTLFYYPSVTAGLLASTRQTIAAVGAVSLIAGSAGWFVIGDALSAVEFALECAFLGLAALAVSRLIIANRELAAARAEVAHLAAADERARIARDLHDLLGHGLSLIAIKAELAGRLLPVDVARAATEVGDIGSVSRRALEDVRATVSGYRRVTLASELTGAQAVLEAAGISVEVDHQAGDLADDLDEALAWSIREGVTNVIRHSNARSSTLRTRREEGVVRLEIVNDGGGRPAWSSDEAAETGGSGLPGLEERIAAVGGHLEAGPRADDGYRLAVVVPVERSTR